MFGFVFEKNQHDTIAINLDKVAKISVFYPDRSKPEMAEYADHIKFEFENPDLNEEVLFASREECEKTFNELLPMMIAKSK